MKISIFKELCIIFPSWLWRNIRIIQDRFGYYSENLCHLFFSLYFIRTLQKPFFSPVTCFFYSFYNTYTHSSYPTGVYVFFTKKWTYLILTTAYFYLSFLHYVSSRLAQYFEYFAFQCIVDTFFLVLDVQSLCVHFTSPPWLLFSNTTC